MFAKKGFNVFENTLATTVNKFVIKELVKVSIYLPIYLSIMLCPSIYPSVFLSISAFTLNPPQKKRNIISTHAYIPYYIEIGPKWLRAETTHLPRPKQPTPKIDWNDPGRNDPAETTQGQTTRRNAGQHSVSICMYFSLELSCCPVEKIQPLCNMYCLAIYHPKLLPHLHGIICV